ncbi:MAG: hypothetical protein H0V95_14775 [Actinobacteria bacterium]|nr:hypothetical protein [Actinomycetota bacterium]
MQSGDRRRAVVCVVLALAAFAACAPGHGGTLGSKRHLEVAAGAQGRASTPVAAAAGPLAPGEYYTSLFEPTITYTVPEGWELGAETEGVVFLGRDIGSERQAVSVTILSPAQAGAAVLDDPVSLPDESDEALVHRSMPVPGDYLSYLAKHQELMVSGVQSTTLLGREGSVADVAVTDRPGDLSCPATTSCLTLLLEQQPGVTPHGFVAGEQERVWDLGAGDDRLIVMVRVAPAVADSFDRLVQDAMSVLASVHFA